MAMKKYKNRYLPGLRSRRYNVKRAIAMQHVLEGTWTSASRSGSEKSMATQYTHKTPVANTAITFTFLSVFICSLHTTNAGMATSHTSKAALTAE